ncbi:MAG TPA: FAD-dependent oxidoreductase [Alphaproteobacteria bacterium]|nr:FAD-dependent oxidoreductase [Alphaproteobacteria bacterium]
MVERLDVDICVIGAGSGGLSVAAGASQLGQKVVLIERGKMGGDCLNYGCVPSKSLIAAARAAHAVRGAARFGIAGGEPAVDYGRVRDHVRGVIGAIAPNDSEERFTGLGVRVIPAAARFTGRDEVEAGDVRVRARRFVIATGSSASVPPIPGLGAGGVPYLTNETIFDLDQAPGHLLIIGGGPIGCELAQAQRRLGCRVTLLEAATLLPKDDPELVDFVRRRLRAEGVEIREGVTVKRVEGTVGDLAAVLEAAGNEERIAGTHLLIATGRRPNLEGLDLEAAGVHASAKGIEVDARLRTSNRKIYAIGDAIGGYQFTHMAGYHAGIVIRNALFRLPGRVDHAAVPWVTYTDPELANVGLIEAEARRIHGDAVRLARWSFHDNDRAQADRETDGLIKITADRRGRILGAGIVGPHAGELLLTWSLAIAKKATLRDIAGLIAPYPTLSEVGKRAAGSFYVRQLFSPRTRRLVRFLARFG